MPAAVDSLPNDLYCTGWWFEFWNPELEACRLQVPESFMSLSFPRRGLSLSHILPRLPSRLAGMTILVFGSALYLSFSVGGQWQPDLAGWRLCHSLSPHHYCRLGSRGAAERGTLKFIPIRMAPESLRLRTVDLRWCISLDWRDELN